MEQVKKNSSHRTHDDNTHDKNIRNNNIQSNNIYSTGAQDNSAQDNEMYTPDSNAHALSFLGEPAIEKCRISPYLLPHNISKYYFKTLPLSRRERSLRRQKAIEAYGQKGRDPQKAGTVLHTLSQELNWTPYIKTAQLSHQWSDIVGKDISNHTHVEKFKDGNLIIVADSTAWLTQLNYLLPQLRKRISDVLAPVEIKNISLKGPHSYTFKRGRFSIPGRGVRDTWG